MRQSWRITTNNQGALYDLTLFIQQHASYLMLCKYRECRSTKSVTFGKASRKENNDNK